MKDAISVSLALDVKMKLAFDMPTSTLPGLTGLLRGLLVLSVPLLLMLCPRICVNGDFSALLESTICATLSRSTPTSFCRAKTVGRCSGGYSNMR